MSFQPQIASPEQPPAAAPATPSDPDEISTLEAAGINLHSKPAGSEDSSMSCPGMFTADRTLTSSARQSVSGVAEAGTGGEKDGAEEESRKAEARLAVLKTRKDDAAKDVKLYIDRW